MLLNEINTAKSKNETSLDALITYVSKYNNFLHKRIMHFMVVIYNVAIANLLLSNRLTHKYLKKCRHNEKSTLFGGLFKSLLATRNEKRKDECLKSTVYFLSVNIGDQ